jgi:hypothetical protein
MIPIDTSLQTNLKAGDECPFLSAEIVDLVSRKINALHGMRAVQPLRLTKSDAGFVLTVDAMVESAAAVDIQVLTTVREGYDAVECIDVNNYTVYCLKPPGFTTEGRIEGVFTFKGYVRGPLETAGGYSSQFHSYKETHILWNYGGSPATRVDRLIKTANSDFYEDDTAIGRGTTVFSIFPYYTEIASGGNAQGQSVVAMKIAAVKLSSASLLIDPAGDVDATFLDTGSRAWVPVGILSAGIECQEYESRAIGGLYIQWPLLGYG